MADAMIHQCTGACAHLRVPDLGGYLTTEPPLVLAATAGQRVEYLGHYGDADWRKPTWRVGGKAWKPMPVNRDSGEGEKGTREIKREHRPAVWLGSGEPVGPVDFSRPSEPEKMPFPAPSLTSDMPLAQPCSAPVSGLLRLAISRGWDGRITQARGHMPHATHGRPSAAEKFSEAVRLRRGEQRAVGVRMDGSWASLWTWSDDQFFTRHATLAAFQEALT